MSPMDAATADPGAARLWIHLRAMAFNNAWANHRLLKACRVLTTAEFAAPRTGFFPSLRATLNHILTVDWLYIDALERSLAGRAPHDRPDAFFEPEEPYGDAAALTDAQRASDIRLISVVDSLRGTALTQLIEIPRRDHVQRERVDRLLEHVYQHQVHHRGQAHAMLSGTAVAPPQLDEFFSAEEASLRAADFAELGFDERQIWELSDELTRRPR
jgi:uncharacterized damage-inducible protein DinB